MNKITKTAIVLTSLFFAVPAVHAAGSNCQVIYGGGEVCPPNVQFSINKQVQRPGKGGDFVDNLNINDPKFGPAQAVNFQITVQNTGNQKITNIQVVDSLPNFLSFVSGPGNFDKNNKTLTYSIDSLDAGKSTTATVTFKTSAEKDLPADQGVTCVTNNVRATKDATVVQDSSQVCIEKKVLAALPTPQVFTAPPMKQTPPTGPEAIVLPLLGSTGILGFFLRRKASK